MGTVNNHKLGGQEGGSCKGKGPGARFMALACANLPGCMRCCGSGSSASGQPYKAYLVCGVCVCVCSEPSGHRLQDASGEGTFGRQTGTCAGRAMITGTGSLCRTLCTPGSHSELVLDAHQSLAQQVCAGPCAHPVGTASLCRMRNNNWHSKFVQGIVHTR